MSLSPGGIDPFEEAVSEPDSGGGACVTGGGIPVRPSRMSAPVAPELGTGGGRKRMEKNEGGGGSKNESGWIKTRGTADKDRRGQSMKGTTRESHQQRRQYPSKTETTTARRKIGRDGLQMTRRTSPRIHSSSEVKNVSRRAQKIRAPLQSKRLATTGTRARAIKSGRFSTSQDKAARKQQQQ